MLYKELDLRKEIKMIKLNENDPIMFRTTKKYHCRVTGMGPFSNFFLAENAKIRGVNLFEWDGSYLRPKIDSGVFEQFKISKKNQKKVFLVPNYVLTDPAMVVVDKENGTIMRKKISFDKFIEGLRNLGVDQQLLSDGRANGLI